MKLFLYVLIAIGFLAAAASYVCWRLVFAVPKEKKKGDPHAFSEEQKSEEQIRRVHRLIDAAAELPYEDVYAESEDHLRLHGKLYCINEKAPVDILFHGYQSVGIRDFCGGLKMVLDSGHNALLVDQRAHGESEGRSLSFGILERHDCAVWVRYVRERFGENSRIYLFGISMGAATVLMAGSLSLPENVKGIVADCGYTSPSEIIRKVAEERRYPVDPVYFFIRLGGRLFGGFDIEEATAEEAMSVCRIPVLFVHGEDDRFVPCEMSRRNYRACAAKKTLELFPDAGHAMSFLVDPERYRKAVTNFWNGIL